MNLREIFPDLTFFVVEAKRWNGKFKRSIAREYIIERTFCTLESSLSIRSIEPFLNNDADLYSIDFWNKQRHYDLELIIDSIGIAFAETGKVYTKNNIEELKKDYLIVKLSGLKQ